MNSYLNIQVRVYTRQAQAALVALDRQLTTTSRAASTASYGAANATKAAGAFKTFGNSVQWAGYQLMHAFTIPILAAAGAAVKYELANEKAMTNVKKVYGDAALAAQDNGKTIRNELKALRREFIALSDVYGQSQTDVINIAEAWAAAGVSGAALGKSVENTLKEMVIGDLNATRATRSLISIQAQYGASTREMTDIVAALNTTENITAVSTADLIDAFERSAAVAADAGVDYKHLAAIVASIVPAAGSAARAGNAIKTIFTDLLAPTKKASDAIKAMGINVDAASWLNKTATERLEELALKYNKLDANQKVVAANYIAGKFQISRFSQMMADLSKSMDKNGNILSVNSKNIGNYGKVLDSTRDNATNLKIAQGELNTVLQSNPQKLKQVWTILKNEAGSAFKGLIPFVIQFITVLAGLMKTFGDASPIVQRWFAIFTIGLALLGPVLLYIAAISKLIHVLGVAFTGAFKTGKWFFGLFTGGMSAEQKALIALEKRVQELRAQLAELMAVSPFDKMTAEAAFLEAEILKIGRASLTAAEEQAAAADIAFEANYRTALARDAQMTAAEKAAAATALAEAKAAAETEAAWQAAYATTFREASAYSLGKAQIIQDELAITGSAAAETVKIWVASGEGIVASWISVTEQQAALAWRAAQANVASAIATATGYAKAYSIIVSAGEAAMAAAAAQETVKQDAMIATIAFMRSQLVMTAALEKSFTAAALTQGASATYAQATNRNAALVTLATWETVYAQIARAAAAAAAAQATAARSAGAAALTGSKARVIEGTFTEGGIAAAGAVTGGAVAAGAGSAAAKTEGIWSKILSGTKAFGVKFFRLINIIFLGIPGLIRGALAPIGAAISGAFAAAAVALGVPIAAIIAIVAAVIAAFLIFRHQIVDAMTAAWRGIVKVGQWIWSGLKDIGGFFASAGNMIVQAIIGLPKVFIAVFKSVVDIVATAAKQVYELFSYLNPFAHHSPSLVENVQKGHDVIRNEHSKTTDSANAHASATAQAHNVVRKSVDQNLGSGSGSPDPTIVQATKDLLAFKNATKNLFPDDFHKNVVEIKKDLPGLIPLVDKLVADYDRLSAAYNMAGQAVDRQKAIVASYQAQLDKLNDKLDVQQKRFESLQKVQDQYSTKLDAAKQKVQDFADTQISGMGAMDDAIFNNQQAQKALQLQMMKMGDATGGIDKAQEKFAALAGDIEKLKGERSNLQQAGAGSDVLGGFDQQIKGLEGQQKAIQSTTVQYDEMNKQLDALQNKAQELDLEKSLKFDPLTRQIDKMTNSMKELPFDQIVSGIQTSQREVNKYQQAYDDATTAVNNQQKVVDKLTSSRDNASSKLDVEQKKLDGLTAKYNTLGDAIDAITSKMQDMSSAASEAAQKASSAASSSSALGGAGGLKAARGGFSIGREGGYKDQSAQIEADMQKQLDKIQGLSQHMDLFGGLKEKFAGAGRWIKKWIWDEPAKWGDWITAQVGNLGPKLWGWVTQGWDIVTHFFATLPGRLGKWLSQLPSVVGHGLVELTHKFVWLLGWLTGFLLVRLPLTIISGAVKLGAFLLRGFSKGMEAFYAWLITVPASIGKFLEALPGLLAGLGWDAIQGLYHGFVDGWVLIGEFFLDLPANTKKFFDKAGDWLSDSGLNILKGLWNGIEGGAKWVWKQITGFVSDFIQGFEDALGIKSPSTIFKNIGMNIIRGLLNGITAIAGSVWNFFTKTLPDKIGSIALKAGSWLVNSGKLLIGSWNGGGLVGGIHLAWDGLVTWIEGLPTWFKNKLNKAGSWLVDAGNSIGRGLVNGITGVFDKIGSIFEKPVYAVFHVVNDIIHLINGVINGVGKVAGIIGLGWHVKGIPDIPIPKGYAQGGQLPGREVGNGFITNGARAIVGEGNQVYPEYVVPTDPKYRKRANMLWAALGKDLHMMASGGRIPVKDESGGSTVAPNGFGKGGVYGGITDAIVNAERATSGKWIANRISDQKNWADDIGDDMTAVIKSVGGWIASTAIDAIWLPVKATFEAGLDNISVPIIKQIGQSWIDKIDGWIDHVGSDEDKKKAASFGFGYNVDRFAPIAGEGAIRAENSTGDAISMFKSLKLIPTILRRLNQESGGDPNAINLRDSNALAGYPSKGIMQVIPPTFDSYHGQDKDLPDNVWDPRSNMAAALTYARSAYGSISTAMNQPGGYAMGGILPAFAEGGIAYKATAGVFGEAGHEVLAPIDPLWNRLDRIESNQNQTVQNSSGDGMTINIYGNIELPNITGQDDAEAFVRNLKRAVSK